MPELAWKSESWRRGRFRESNKACSSKEFLSFRIKNSMLIISLSVPQPQLTMRWDTRDVWVPHWTQKAGQTHYRSGTHFFFVCCCAGKKIWRGVFNVIMWSVEFCASWRSLSCSDPPVLPWLIWQPRSCQAVTRGGRSNTCCCTECCRLQ